MKNQKTSFIVAAALVAAFLIAVPVLRAEDAEKPSKPKKAPSAKVLAKYDANKNGQLDADEEALMKADKKKEQEEKKAKKAAKEAAPQTAS